MRLTLRRGPALCVLSLLLIAGCSHAPMQQPAGSGYTPAIGRQAVRIAVSMIDKPYQYQGNSPEGFDCSGLVQYSYLAAGLEVPHGTKNLIQATKPVGAGLREGDLLFFNEKRGGYSHVGIYLGNDIFVHAPSSGGKVRKDSLRDPHWKRHFQEARRFP